MSVLPYFWVLATPVVGAVFGAYLYVSLNVFECHYNEAFSALRISSYKNFLRLHVQPNGDLEVFAFGIDKMPRKWCRYVVVYEKSSTVVVARWRWFIMTVRLTQTRPLHSSDPNWSGGTHMTPENQRPSHEWRFPSYWKPVVTTVDSMLRLDFENPSLDAKFNTTDRSNVQLVDRVLVRKRCIPPPPASE